jgi:hypothetical protein
VSGELRKKAFGAVFGRGAEEYGFEFQSAADGFFENAHAFDGAIAVGRDFTVGKGCAQLFDEGVVASLDASQSAGRVVGSFLFHRLVRIITVYLSLQWRVVVC